MKVDFYTYNQPNIKCSYPVFTAKPIRINWKSESGKLIERTLLGIAAVNAAALINSKNNTNDTVSDSPEDVNSLKKQFENNYKSSKDPNILDKHARLYLDAYKSKDILKGGYSDVTNEEIDKVIISPETVTALGILGKGNLEAAFELDFVGYNNFLKDFAILTKYISKKDLEILKKKINPENTVEYRKFEEKVKEDKKEINELLGEENRAKRKELCEKIEALKGDKNNEHQIRELKKEIQNLYKNCEKSSEIEVLMQDINKKQKQMKDILAEKVNLSPQEVINRVWTISSLHNSQIYTVQNFIYDKDALLQRIKQDKSIAADNKFDGIPLDKIDEEYFKDGKCYIIEDVDSAALRKDVKKLINLINSSSPENDKAWHKAVDKMIFDHIGYTYNDVISNLFNFSKCKYLNQLIISDEDFWNNLQLLLDGLVFNIAASKTTDDSFIGMSLDNMDHNWETRKQFDRNKLDYDKWTHYDKNSFIEDNVTIKREDAKNKAVKNMCNELTNTALMQHIPREIQESLYNKLKEIGVNVNLKEKQVSINGREVEYSDLAEIMSVIKKEMNTKRFWSEENKNEKTEDARDNLYNHFMYQRKQEIDNVKRLKESETVNIKVQKVDMSDLKHSLSLGNDSHCCTALGSQSNEWSAPAYILTRCIGAIEVIANGEAIGNTMMYFAHINGELGLVLDDIELQTKFQNNDKIRDTVVKYAKQICAEVGKPDIPIFAGPGMHKVDMSKYEMIKDATMKIIGKTCNETGVYLDFDGEEHHIGNIKEKTDLYRIA